MKFGNEVRQYIYDEVWPDNLQILFIPNTYEYNEILNMRIKNKFKYYKYNNDICSRNYLLVNIDNKYVKLNEYIESLP